MPSSKDKYTKPKLRDEVKEEVQQSDKGGARGQWSARKAQLMAKEYKQRGGGYKTDKKDQDESQKHLSKWTEEEWQTKEGSAHAKQEDGTRKRYLPKKAWENMNENEKEETEEKKQEGSKEGKQFVLNTSRARSARKNANEEEDEAYERKKEQEKAQGGGRQTRSKTKRDTKQEVEAPQKDDTEENRQPQNKKAGQKRSRGGESQQDANETPPSKKMRGDAGSTIEKKRNDIVGSKHEKVDPPAKQASKTRSPRKAQTAR